MTNKPIHVMLADDPLAQRMAWAEGRAERLTKRELEALTLVTRGLSNKEIGYRLHVTERTVEFHVSNILRRLGLNSRVEAAVWAKDHPYVLAQG